MALHGNCLATLEKSELLDVLRDRHARAGRILAGVEALHELGYLSSSSDFTVASGALARKSHWVRALYLLATMGHSRLEPNSISGGAAVSACEKARRWQEALHVLSDMAAAGVEIDLVSHNTLLSACNKAEQWLLVSGILEEMQGQKLRPSRISYGSAITACEKHCWEPGLRLIAAMKASHIEMDLVSCNAALSTCWQHTSWATAFMKLPEMRTSMLKPDVISYSSLVGSCKARGRWELAWQLLASLSVGGLEADNICFNTAISACERCEQWQAALSTMEMLLGSSLQPSIVSYSAAMSSCRAGWQWEKAMSRLASLQQQGVELSVVTFSAMICSVQEFGRWMYALDALVALHWRGMQTDRASHNALVSACEKAHEWERAFTGLSQLRCSGLEADIISLNAAISACKSAEQWKPALAMLSAVQAYELRPDVSSHNAAISACEKAGQWAWALNILADMWEKALQANDITYTAAIGACERCGRLSQGLKLLSDASEQGCTGSTASLPWMLAKLSVHERSTILAAFADVMRQLKTCRNSPQELSTLWWAAAMLGVRSRAFSSSIAAQATSQIAGFSFEELLMAAWGATASLPEPRFYRALQDEASTRLAQLNVDALPRDAWVSLRNDLLGILWACKVAGCVSERLLVLCRSVLQRRALAFRQLQKVSERGRGGSDVASVCMVSPAAAAWSGLADPRVILELPDRAVVFKPPGWEVRNQGVERQLLLFVQELVGKRKSLLWDSAQRHGFVHRLDVPSSGLILFAKTHEAYHDLHLQLSAGGVARDYVVLSHGWLAQGLRELRTHVFWRGDAPTVAGVQGKPSRTCLKLIAHICHEVGALSMLAVRIATGRRHQVRTHLAHAGHATVCDGLYTSSVTLQFDLSLCERNCLHRHRLAFEDSSRQKREAVTPLPQDLVNVLQQVSCKGQNSMSAIRGWISNHVPESWAECHRLVAQDARRNTKTAGA